MTPLKAVHVSTVHPMPDVRILVRQCRSLAAAGHDVTLYGRTETEHVEEGVRMVPVPVPEPRSRMKRMTVDPWRLLKPLLAEQADVYHLHDPELIPLGLALRARGCTVIFDAHEPLPLQIYDKPWIPQPLRPFVSGMTKLLVGAAGRGMNAIVAASPVAAETFKGARQVVTVNNFPAISPEDTGDGGTPYEKRSREIVYVGGMSYKRGWTQMLEVARLVNEHVGARVTLAGPFHPPTLEADLARPEIARAVDYLGMLAPEDARQVMTESKVGLVLFQRTRAHERAMPNKLFEYMAAGVPIVASDFTHWRGFITGGDGLGDADCGVLVEPSDPAGIATAIEGILADPVRGAEMSANGRRAASRLYTWSSEERNLLELYERLGQAGKNRQNQAEHDRPDQAEGARPSEPGS